MSILAENLAKQYGSQWAVNHISFAIETGEIVGFLGPNGAGKSTTMKMLTGYIPPTQGRAQICGLDVTENSIKIKEKIGYLPEHNPLYLDMYVKEYLDFAAGLNHVKNRNKAVNHAIDITQLGLEKGKKIGQLSKGYRQRVGLAQALIHNPAVLILDEPTSGLDPIQVMEMRNVIKDLGQEKTVLLSTHIMQEVEAMCSRVLIINQGNIVANSDIQTLQQKGENLVSITVEFAEMAEPIWINTLVDFQSMEKIGGNQYRIYGKSKQIREQLSQKASQNGFTIVEMQLEKNSLEDVFKTLTHHVDHI